jgi:Ca2+-binding EF-hand superfamily protein
MSKDFITSDDIYKYLQNDSDITPMSAYLLLKEWDTKDLGKLYYQDFIKIILPVSFSSPKSPPIQASNCESTLKKLLKSELSYILKLETAKHALVQRKDFNTFGCFSLIDNAGSGYITPHNLQSFLQTLKNVNTGHIGTIMRRLDKDKDGRISYTEFIKAVTPASKVYGSEENFKSVFSSINSPHQTPDKKIVLKARTSKKNKKKIRKSGSEKFARFLMQQILLEKELEKKRKVLSLRIDFSIGKLFELMDLGGKGRISINDLDESLRQMGIVAELNQCHLLFRQYDRDNDNYLLYWDFCDIFSPKTSEYFDLSLNKVMSKDKKDEISLETLEIIVDTFILLLNIQSVTEDLKQKMYRPSFNVQEIFQEIDMNGLGFLTRGCFRNLLRKHKYYATDRDLEGILVVYDANKDGKITFSKFVHGLCPKCPNTT